MKELLHQTIVKIYIDPEKKYLTFCSRNLDFYVFKAEQECCSETWFESINGIENLINQEVISVEYKEIPGYLCGCGIEKIKNIDCLSCGRDDSYVQCYGYTLKTIKGYCDIEFRNESNGYYGGECLYLEEAIINKQNLHPCGNPNASLILLDPNNSEKKIQLNPWPQ